MKRLTNTILYAAALAAFFAPAAWADSKISALGSCGTLNSSTDEFLVSENATTNCKTNSTAIASVVFLQNATNLTLATGGALRTATSNGNTALLRAYDVDNTQYVTFGTLTAGNTPTFDLASSVTIGSAYLYRVGGNDVSVADGGTGISWVDPNEDQVLFWDDSEGTFAGLAVTDLGGVSDGDKGDIVISSSGTVFSIDSGVIVNADVNASASIALSKLAATTASRALVSDGSGFVSAATTTATEIGYVNGVTSAIQTQIDAKQAVLTNSAGLRGALSDETGTGLAVFNNAPTLIAPVLGTIASGVGTALTALDGENIQDDTIDDDSIDFSDVTLADITFDVGSVSTTEFGYLNNATSEIQAQIDALSTPTVITVADTTDSTSFCGLFEAATGDLGPKTDAGCTYNASNGTLAPTILSTANVTLTGTGTLTDLDAIAGTTEATLEAALELSELQGAVTDGQVPNNITVDLATLASTVTVVDGTDSTSFPLIADAATGSLAVKTDGGLLYDASNGTLSSTIFNTPTLTLTGTGTLNGLDAIDGTGETTLEAALDIAGDITGTGLGSVSIASGVIEPDMLDAAGPPTDEWCLTYETTTSQFDWQDCAADAGTNQVVTIEFSSNQTVDTIPAAYAASGLSGAVTLTFPALPDTGDFFYITNSDDVSDVNLSESVTDLTDGATITSVSPGYALLVFSNANGNGWLGTYITRPSSILSEDDVEAYIFDADAQNVSGVWEVQDDIDLVFGNDANWAVNYDESVDDQLLFITAGTAAGATTDPMVEFLVGGSPTADQQVFGVAKGTQASNTALFTVDEDGDGVFAGALNMTGTLTGSGTFAINGLDQLDSTSESTIESQLDALTSIDSIDGNGAVDMDYGSADITDHTFTSDGGTVIIDGPASINGLDALKTMFIPAVAMKPRTTSGCAALATVEISSTQPEVYSLDCDASSDEGAQFQWVPPKGWDNGTITYAVYWSHASTTTNFAAIWGMECLAVSNDDAIGASFGTAVTVTDTGGTTNDLYVSPTSSAVTIGGTPADADEVFCRIYRDANAGGDTLAIDARLMGVAIFYTQDTEDDT